MGARHLSRMPAPVGAQLLGQGLVALQIRLRGLRSSMDTLSFSSTSLSGAQHVKIDVGSESAIDHQTGE